MSKPQAAKYRTTNWNAYNASLVRRGTLILWLDKDMEWFAAPSGKRGRCETFSDVAIQFCLMLKNLYGLPLRQTTGMVSSILQLAHLDWPAPDYSTLCRRQKDLTVNIGYMRNSHGLHLLIDSTGIKMMGEGEWKTKKYGAEYRRQWRKVHLGIDADTLEIRAIEVTSNEIGDAPMLPELLKQIPVDEPISLITADGAYDTKHCHEAIASRQAQAIIPVRKNGKLWKDNTAGVNTRNEALSAIRRLGLTIWKKWSGYHRRSAVEAKMRCFKLLGERVKAKRFDSQVVELHIRAALLNWFSGLGTEPVKKFVYELNLYNIRKDTS